MTTSQVIYDAYTRTEKPLLYNTRDKDGNDIIKEANIRDVDCVNMDCSCAFCGDKCARGVNIKNAVSSNFTDWNLLHESDYVCEKCILALNLFRYSFIASKNLRLLNVREMVQAVQETHEPPFVIVISTSQKKHLFYKAVVNQDSENFIANLEEERIMVNLAKLRQQFAFVSNLQALGESKERLKIGEIRYDILKKVGSNALRYLKESLKQRDIQIPLFLSQKVELEEGQAIKNIWEVIS